MEIDPAWLQLGVPHSLPSFNQQVGLIDAALQELAWQGTDRDIIKNGGIAADCVGRHATAIGLWEELSRLNNEDHEAHYELGCQHLLLGKYEAGWQDYLHYFQTPQYVGKVADFPPIWDGHSSADGILVFADQGYGDAIMTLRYVPQLSPYFQRKLFFCDDSLAPLAEATNYFEAVVTPNAIRTSRYGSLAGMHCQYHAPVMSLPAHFHAFAPDYPPPPGYFQVDAALINYLRRPFADSQGIRVAVAWKGKPSTPRDPLRSFEPALLRPLTQTPGTTFFAIQWEAEDQEIEDLGPGVTNMYPTMRRMRFRGRPWSLLETAAFVGGMDLVITCDSVVAHVAGAMNVTTWIPLPFASEWRWGLNKRYGLWYPENVRLFRQNQYGNWAPVFDAMKQELQRMVT